MWVNLQLRIDQSFNCQMKNDFLKLLAERWDLQTLLEAEK